MSRRELKAFFERSIEADLHFNRVNIYSPNHGGDDQFIHDVRSLGLSDKKLFIGAGYHEGTEIDLNNILAVDFMCLEGGRLLHIFRRF